jgi:hypothetical protein
VEQRQRYLHFLLQQNIFSIQTYDYLWSEYQRTTSCSEIGAFLMSKVHDEAFHGLPFTPIPPDDAINAPPAVFALQASLTDRRCTTMLARFFVFRPVFAAVIAICIMAAGALALLTLPVEQYPDIAPPGVNVTANYPGASAETVEDSVTQVLEQQIKGIDGLLYFSSSSSSAGQARISLSFDQRINPDMAQVQVQNAVNQAITRLPQEVQQQGIAVTKSQGDSLMVVALYDQSRSLTSLDISDFLVSSLQEPLSRVEGVGETTVFGAQYAMRIWLNPLQLTSYGLMPSDVQAAIEAQNSQVTSGEIGSLPTLEGQYLNATVTTQSALSVRNSSKTLSCAPTATARWSICAMSPEWRSARKTIKTKPRSTVSPPPGSQFSWPRGLTRWRRRRRSGRRSNA